jgi:hypothetical protein
MPLFANRVVGSHGLGNQFFQLTFAHYLKRITNDQIVFENNPLFSKGLNYMLMDMHKYCKHINFRMNKTISHESFFGRSVMKSKNTKLISSIFMKNFFLKKIYAYNEQVIFDFNNKVASMDSNRNQYFGFFLNWQYVYSERKTLIPEILELVEEKSGILPIKFFLNKTLIIHVRRGDYLTRGNDEILGVVSPDSYKFIIQKIQRIEPNLEIFTITDDPDLGTNTSYGKMFGKIYDRGEINEWQALQLMINANYVIAANSTFSWWGATLSFLKNGNNCYIPKNFYKKLDDKKAFLFPGLKTYDNSHL